MRKLYPLIFLFFVSAPALLAQETPTIDSLKRYIAVAPDDTNKVNAMFMLGRQYDLFKSKEHVSHFISALNLAQKLGYKKGMLKVYNSLTLYLLYKDMYATSTKYAIEYLNLLQEMGLEEDKYKVYALLGNLAIKQGNTKEASNYYNMVSEYRLKTNNAVGYANSMTNFLILSMECGAYDSAIAYGTRAAQLYQRNNMRSEMANAILGIAEAFMKKGNYAPAEQKAHESYDAYRLINLPHGMSNSLYVIGQIYSLQNRFDTAIATTRLALHYADTLNLLPMERDCYKSLAELYKKKNDYLNAYENQVLYKKYEDSLALETQMGKMLQYEVEYDISKKENLLMEQQFEIDEKNKQRNYLLLGISGIVVLLLISYRAYKQKKTSSEIIAKQKELVEDKQKEILDSINYAKRIQSAILAKESDIRTYFKDSFLLYKPKDIVAGDFYFFEVTDSHIFYAAADCTGHGVPGALMSVVCANSLTRCVKEFGLKNPGEILDRTRELVVETLKKSGEEMKDGMDISLCAFKKDMSEIKWAGANNPLWFIKSSEFHEINADKQPIGLYDKATPFTTHLLSLNKGDMIFLFTDGYADQFGGPKGKKFKYKQFKEILLEINAQETSIQAKILEEKFINWKAELDQVDDICVIGIRL